MLRPTLLFGAVITGIGYLQFFEEPFVMTKGGPLDSTRSVTFYTFDQFGFGNYGYAAAASYLLFLAIVAADRRAVPAARRRRTDDDQTLDRPTAVAPPRRHRAATRRSRRRSRASGDVRTPGVALRRAGRRAGPRRRARSSGCWSRRSSPRPRSARCRRPGGRETPTLENYDTLFTELDFPTYFVNSAIVALAVTVGQHGLLLDAGLRPGQAATSRASGCSSCSCSAR